MMALFKYQWGWRLFDIPKAFFDHALPFVARAFEYLRGSLLNGTTSCA